LLQAAAEYGYSLHPFNLPDNELADLHSGTRLAGMIVYGGHWNPHLLAELSRLYPTVLMGGSIPNTQVDSVWVDSTEGISLATNHLLSKGHRTLALINGPTDCITSWEKGIGFERSLSSTQDLNIKGVTVQASEFRKESGKVATRQLLEHVPNVTGIIAGEGNLGLGIL
jgi:DNA-binding LacI/PurR family transcriptional regulator